MLVITGTVAGLTRKGNSLSGNPVWTVVLSNGSDVQYPLVTKDDAVIGHAITPDLIGQEVRVTVDGKGFIIDLGMDP